MRFRITKNDVEKNLRKLMKTLEPQNVVSTVIYPPARHVLSEAQRAAPVDMGTLVASAHLEIPKSEFRIRIGFRARWSAFQDGAPALLSGRRQWEIRPRVKKALYVPISRRGRRIHARGRNPSDEGLVWGEDYVLRRKVTIQIKRPGSALGPNQYFSSTWQRRKKWVMQQMTKRTRAVLRKGLGRAR